MSVSNMRGIRKAVKTCIMIEIKYNNWKNVIFRKHFKEFQQIQVLWQRSSGYSFSQGWIMSRVKYFIIDLASLNDGSLSLSLPISKMRTLNYELSQGFWYSYIVTKFTIMTLCSRLSCSKLNTFASLLVWNKTR